MEGKARCAEKRGEWAEGEGTEEEWRLGSHCVFLCFVVATQVGVGCIFKRTSSKEIHIQEESMELPAVLPLCGAYSVLLSLIYVTCLQCDINDTL